MSPLRITALTLSLALFFLMAPGDNHAARVYAEDAAAAGIAAPIARIVPKTWVEHGRRRDDDYDWLRNRDDPAVVAYLQAENAYADRRLAVIRPLADDIAAEMRSRDAREDVTVPYLDNGYLYERRFTQGAQYPVIVRRRNVPDAPEQVVLDIPSLAAGHPYYRVNRWEVSPDGARVAFAVDFTGGRSHRIFVRTIATGEVSHEGIVEAAPRFAFAADSQTLFYVRLEPQTLRSYEIWRHRIGTDAGSDVRVYTEQDPRFEVFVFLSKSRKFVLIACDGEQTSEMRYLRADQPDGAFKVMEPRRDGVRYFANHVGDRFFIRTNLDAPDYRLMAAPQDEPDAAHWSELISHRPGRHIDRFEAFNDFVAIDEQHEGAIAVRVLRLSDMSEVPLPLPGGIGVATTDFVFGRFGGNRDPASHVLRLRYSAPLVPERTYDFDMATGALTLRKQDAAARWFRPDAYAVERIEATAADGENIPVTVVYRKDLRRPGGNPTLVLGYGAYGFSSRPVFSTFPYSLIDRGFVYAIAHVRGGHERGERWYDEGRLLKKRNTFTDFIVASEALVAKGYADRRALFAQGRSAGGLLVGAVANMRPDLFTGIVAEVPFVDVLTTMADASVPLTTLEYEEWGNPAIKAQYDYMRSYSPCDNVEHKAYPAMFVTAGFRDSQVSYAEPAKWVARLRANKTDDHDILLKVDMDAGHGGRPGRLGSVNETAEIIAWLVVHAQRAPPH
jgi:oligopeptidase B